MNLSPNWVDVFAKYGIVAKHWSTIGKPMASDKVIMEWALENNYIVFTNDLDFGALLAATQAQFPSVIQVRTQDLFPDSLETILIQSLNRFQSELESGALITLDLSRAKVRILPIRSNNN